MNSLSYLARQFDSIASPKTPPSTPTDNAPGSALKRVSTWSTTFLFPNTPSNTASLSRSRPRAASNPPLRVPRSSGDKHGAGKPSIIRPRHVESAFKRTLLVRAALLMWNAIHALWVSLPPPKKIEHVAPVEITPPEKTDAVSVQDQGTVALHSPPLLPPYTYPRHPKPIPEEVEASNTPHSSSAVTALQQSEASSSIPRTRSPTPALSARKTAYHLLPKTLVLDLDETLIHSTSRPIFTSGSGGSGLLGLGGFGRRNKGAGHMVEVVLGGRSTLYHVYKRPFVDFFLRTVAGWYTVVIFTASMQEYADPVIDWLDAGRGILVRRFFRDSCTQLPNGSYTKDLSVIEPDLSRVCLVDNSPISYRINEANGIPIEGWTHDPSDEALLDLLPVLDSLRFTGDVRRVLGIRGFSV